MAIGGRWGLRYGRRLVPGDRIGRYEIVKHLATGGIGEIYLAMQQNMSGVGQPAALKILRPELAQDSSIVEMIIDEAKISMFLQQANIVSILDFIRHEETYCLVMEYVDGMTIEHLLDGLESRGRALELALGLHIGIELCRALKYAHGCKNDQGEPLNIIHRDVTPANVLVSMDGDVKLTDFGLARAAGRLQHTEFGVIKGRFGYLPPEVVRMENIDHRADLFSLGVVLYELLAGVHPMAHVPAMTAIINYEAGKIDLPSQYNTAISPRLDEAIMRCLRPNPKDRWPSAQALGDELQNVALSSAALRGGLKRAPEMLATIVRSFEGPAIEVEATEDMVFTMPGTRK